MAELEINQKSTDSSGILSDTSTEIKDLKELKVGAGSGVTFTDKYGTRWGSISFDTAPAWIKTDGSFKFKNSNGDVIIDSNAADGNFIQVINNTLNTASKKILTDFTFESTDYAGAFKTGNPTWDEETGLPTGGTGFIINAAGILGVKDGVTTVAITADGSATFAGTLSAPSGTLGTITAGTITGATIQSAATGYRVKMSSSGFQLLSGDTVKGSIDINADNSVIINTADNIYFFQTGGDWLGTLNADGLLLPTGNYISIGGFNGIALGTRVITALDYDGDQLRYKYRDISGRGGIVTDNGAESGWNNVS